MRLRKNPHQLSTTDPKLFIEDPKIFVEDLKTTDFRWRPSYFHWRLQTNWGLRRKVCVSIENVGGLQQYFNDDDFFPISQLKELSLSHKL